MFDSKRGLTKCNQGHNGSRIGPSRQICGAVLLKLYGRNSYLTSEVRPPPTIDDRTAPPPPPPWRPTQPGMVVARAAMDRFTRTMCTIERPLLAPAAAAGKGFRLQYPAAAAAAAAAADADDNRRIRICIEASRAIVLIK